MKEWIPKDNLPSSVTFVCPYCNGQVTYYHGSSSKSRKNSGTTKRCLYEYCPWCQEKVEPYRANILPESQKKEQEI